ncbi:hypothetical protein H5410_004296 [Solanum commersonii]|uniref:Uncharacterized protein n=1 Tax=Solanum commersonii TaxID=4109 RepID=A0A9J6B7K8_SOLCO|nr:hypothetical protein H5410_004296 [Solanum commersonii]
MELQDEQNSTCSSSIIVPIENESQMPSQTNEATNEIDGFRFSVCRYCNALIKSIRNYGPTSMLEHFRRCTRKPTNLITEGGLEVNDGNQQQYFDQDVSNSSGQNGVKKHNHLKI